MVKGDKIKLIKPCGVLRDVGAVYTVKDISSIGFTFEDDKTLGFTTFNSADCFEVINPDSVKKNEWSDWDYRETIGINPFGDDTATNKSAYIWCDIHCRTNDKRVQLCTQVEDSVIRAEASCAPQDKFSLEKGIKLAMVRLVAKIYEKLAEKMAKEM